MAMLRSSVISVSALTMLSVALAAGCGPNQRIIESANTAEPSAAQPSDGHNEPAATDSFEGDVKAMRTANFNFIYVFRRRDGAALTPDDKRFMAAETPPEINRRKVSDAGKAVIMGSNFRVPPENLKRLTEKYELEDLSKPGLDANTAEAAPANK
jgi:hypothetical protein